MQHETTDDDSIQDGQECLTVASGDGQDCLTAVSGNDPVPVHDKEDPKLLFTSVTISDTVTAKEPGSTGEYTLYVIEVRIHASCYVGLLPSCHMPIS